MTRVIAGAAGGIRLTTPKGLHTRPTSDRVKESLFAILGARVHGAVVLDVFAGSGALGIEALSRGAKRAYFIENDRRARACIAENLVKTRFGERAVLVAAKGLPSRRQLGAERFDLVFADPPYDVGYVARALRWLEREVDLADEALIVVERSRKEEIPADLKKFLVIREETYGQTALSFLHRAREGPASPSSKRIDENGCV